MQIPTVLSVEDVDELPANLPIGGVDSGQTVETQLRFLILNWGWEHREFPSDPNKIILLALAALNAPHPDLESKICAAAYVLSRSANAHAAEARA